MAMPPQLARSNRRHNRRSEPRPTIELMPSISINELRHVIPRYPNDVYEPNIELKYPHIARLRLFASHIEITGRNGHIQYFRIEWIKTGLGAPRAILVCSCGYGAIRLFARYGNYACRHCHKAVYASQRHNQFARPRLAASKLRIKIGSWPDINEPIAPKPKWKRKRRYQALRHQVEALETQAKQTRFRKPIPTQLFAYHAG
jgi:hypothetical protein